MLHVTCQGNDGSDIFREPQDRIAFLERIANYLSPERRTDSTGRPYAKLGDEVELHAFSPMNSHYHLPMRQTVEGGATNLMRRVQTSYARYFNNKYGGVGPVFRSRYTAKPILTTEHYRQVILYTHLQNVRLQLDYPFNSHRALMGEESFDWLSVDSCLELFEGGRAGYVDFTNEYGAETLERKCDEIGVPHHEHPFRPVLWTP
jgi:putative transposase